MEEGIKFNCTWIQEPPVEDRFVTELNYWRDRLYALGVIGVTSEGIGFGNMSIRFEPSAFLVTGSGTGKYEKLSAAHYTLVTGYSVEDNSVLTQGPIKASSESLTHAMIYECGDGINAVIHVHHLRLWKHLLQKLPATDKDVPYGTPAMAQEIARLFRETNIAEQKIFAMGGHEEGIISFGKNLDEAGAVLLHQLDATS
jgi:ribulose-5-phosphate 4-epimerase/fuculose-1-phosphate aldolase